MVPAGNRTPGAVRNHIRTIIGFGLAPLMIPLVMVACALLRVPLPLTVVGEQSLQFSASEGLGLGKIALLLGYIVTLVGAVPAHLQFMRRGWTRSWMYGALGALLGTIPWLIYAAMAYLSDLSTRDFPLHVLASFVVLGVACGVPAALLFWLIAVRS